LEDLLSGIQEILLILLLILALLVLPRMISPKRAPITSGPSRNRGVQFSGKLRLALLASLLWLFAMSAIYVPWRGQWLAFFYAGIGPLVFIWGVYWVVSGFRNYRRH
jgi:hypothetical protein